MHDDDYEVEESEVSTGWIKEVSHSVRNKNTGERTKVKTDLYVRPEEARQAAIEKVRRR